VVEQLEQQTPPWRKQCSSCGAEFGCAQGEPGCWCESVVLRRETLAEIRALADDCLCPACLSGYAERERSDSDGSSGPAIGGGASRWAKAIPHAAIRARGVPFLWGLGAVLFVIGSLLFALATGPISIGAGSIAEAAISHLPVLHIHSSLSTVERAILWQIRAPRVVLAALVGGMLAVAGSAYQGVFRNPLADPYFLGVAAGAGLGATLAIAYRSAGSSRPGRACS